MKNLKSTSLIIFGFVALMALSACGKKSGGTVAPQGPIVSSYAMPPECRSVPTRYYSGSRWESHRRYGVEEYGWGRQDRRQDRRRNNSQFINGCNARSFAACAPGIGIVCVPGKRLANSQVAWYNYTLGARDSNFCGYSHYSQADQFGGPGMNTLGLICRLDNPVACAGIGSCQPIARNSSLGVCVR